MVDSFRLRVMKALTAQLKSITPDNGYAHDMSDFTDSAGRTAARVFRGRTVYGENDPLPMLSIVEDPRAQPAENGGKTTSIGVNAFRVLIQGFVQDDPDNPLDPTYALSAEVVAALVKAKLDGRNLFGFGSTMPCVNAMSIGQAVHRPPDDDVSTVAYFLVPVTLTLTENLETPFA